MAEKPDGNGTTAAALSRFVAERVAPLSKAFALTPLMELRVRTSEGSIRLVKTAPEPHAVQARPAKAVMRSGPRPQLTMTVEPGHTMVELHSNFTIEGRRVVMDGLAPTNHAEHETIEITHGFSDWFETNVWRPLLRRAC